MDFVIDGDESIQAVLGDQPCITLDWLKGGEQLSPILSDTEVVIIDSYRATPEILREITDRVDIPVFLDDFCRIDYPPGFVVNWGIHAADLDYPEKQGTSYLLGPDFIALRKAFRNVPPRRVPPQAASIMVTFGGEDPHNLTATVTQFLTRRYPGMKKNIVIGGGFSDQAEIRSAADDSCRFIFAPDAEGMKQVMLAADIAVSAGGQTLYELARTGLPTVAVAVAENQRYNIEAWAISGFAEKGGTWEDPHLLRQIDNGIRRLLPFETRRRASETGQRVVPPDGAGRIIDSIESERNCLKLNG